MASTVGVTGTSQIGDIQPSLIAPIKYTLMHKGVMQALVTRITGKQGQDDTYNQPKIDTVTAYGATEGTPVAIAQQITDSNVSVSATEVITEVVLTRKLDRTTAISMARVAGKVMGDAMAKKKDQDLLSLIDGFDTSLIGAGNAFTVGHLLAARTRLDAGTEPAPRPFATVLHSYHWHDIAVDILNLGSSAFQDELPEGPTAQVFRDYMVGRMFDVPILIDNNISVDSSDDAKSGIFSKESIILYDWMTPQTHVGDDMGLRANRIQIIADYGTVEYDGTFGYELLADATAPTS